MKKIVFYFLIIISTAKLFAQNKTPFLIQWIEKREKKIVAKYVVFDTIITTSSARIHLHYSKDTVKPYLLLLHGMGSNGPNNWNAQVKTLSKSFNLILPDLVYSGTSTSDIENLSLEFQAEQIHEAIIKLGIITKIHVMGFSYGGLTAAVYNELFHNHVNKLIIMDAPVKYYSTRISDSLANAVGMKNMNQILAPQTIEEFDAMQKAVMATSMHITKQLKRKIIKYMVLPTKPIKDKQMDYLTVYQKKYQDYNYHLDETTTLLIWGGKDGVIPASVAIQLHQTFPKTTQLIIYPNAKHDAPFSETRRLNDAVSDFLLKK